MCNNVYNMEQKHKTNGRTKVMLETWPAHRLADVFVASFEVSFEEHLSMLDAVDLRLRLSKATEIVIRHLQVLSSLLYQIEKNIQPVVGTHHCLARGVSTILPQVHSLLGRKNNVCVCVCAAVSPSN